ncbi:C-5 cytosine-specific DNA methylase (plasmid) [Nostoc sp. HK-01]|nr:C-5 cytosine-specific DNA methylase [Nostoc sp. HK-01]
MSVATPEKSSEKGLKSSDIESVGYLYPYLETKKLQDGSTALYPRVIGERDPNNASHWRWAFNWKEKIKGVWKGRSIGSIPCGAVTIIREMQKGGVYQR